MNILYIVLFVWNLSIIEGEFLLENCLPLFNFYYLYSQEQSQNPGLGTVSVPTSIVRMNSAKMEAWLQEMDAVLIKTNVQRSPLILHLDPEIVLQLDV